MNKEETRVRIGQRVASLQKLSGLTQEELAVRAGLQRTHIGRIEDGRYGVNVETLQAIAEAMGMTVDLVEPQLADLRVVKMKT